MIPFQINSRNPSGILPSTASRIRSSFGMARTNLQNPRGESGYRSPCGFRIRYQLTLSFFLLSMALPSSISSTEQKTAFTSGCFSSRVLTAVFFPAPGILLRQTARCFSSMDSIQTVLSMTTFLRFTLSSTKSSIPSLRTDNGPLLLPAAGSDQHFSKHYCAFSPDYLFHPAAVKQKKIKKSKDLKPQAPEHITLLRTHGFKSLLFLLSALLHTISENLRILFPLPPRAPLPRPPGGHSLQDNSISS